MIKKEIMIKRSLKKRRFLLEGAIQDMKEYITNIQQTQSME